MYANTYAEATYNNHRLWPLYSVSQHLQLRTGGFCWCKVYCPHALADGNQRIRIREKTLEFSSTVLSTLSLYLAFTKFLTTTERHTGKCVVFEGTEVSTQKPPKHAT